MRRIRTVLCFAAAVALHASAFAAQFDEDVRRVDANLNTTYQRLMERLSNEQKASLRQAQREWIKFRDATCAFESGIKASESAAAPDSSCVYGLTSQRVLQLSASLKSLERAAAAAAAQRIRQAQSS